MRQTWFLLTVVLGLGLGEARAERRDLYLASRDEIRFVERSLDALPPSKGHTLVGIVGGLAVLSFIERLAPSDILLVDLNPAQVEYGRCVIALIKAQPSRADFVSAFFARPFTPDLSEAAFLAQPGDPARLAAATEAIADPALRASCRADLGLIATATYDRAAGALRVRDNSNGAFLRLRGPDEGMPIGFNFLYYDRGWLASDASYLRTRAALLTAKTRFMAGDIGATPLDDVGGDVVVFWGTNLATWFDAGRDGYERFVVRAHEAFLARNVTMRFVFLSTYRHVAWTDFLAFEQRDPGVHLDVSAKVRKHAEGKRVLELIPGKGYFGRELRAANITVRKAAQGVGGPAFDTAVLHILNNSGFKWWRGERAPAFRALYDAVLGRAREVIVVEHNRMSADFDEAARQKMVGLAELLAPVFELLAKKRVTLALETAIGHQDNTRNLVLHVVKH